ncbi:MAG: hypothetical protein OXE17_06925 [Chloroflexi bacterium]|nr:hypothetical protein [Chloroflexota bacterium]
MMQSHGGQPLYAAKDRVPFNLTLVLALGIAAWGAGAVFGLWDMGGNPSVIFMLGIAVAIYTWLFTPREYLVYDDAFCVAYGMPRVKTIHFNNIAVIEMGSMATLDQLRVRPVRGRRQSIRVREPDAFFDALEGALNRYRDTHPEENVPFQVTGRPQPTDVDVIEGEPVVMAEAGAPAAEAAPVQEAEPTEVVEATVAEGAEDAVDSVTDSAVEDTVESSEVAGAEPAGAESEDAAAETDEDKPREPGSQGFY